MMNNHILSGSGWAKTFTPDGSNGLATIQPSNGWVCPRATSITVSGKIEAILNGPTTWAWRLVPEVQYPHTSDFQFSRPDWRQVTPATLGFRALDVAQADATGILLADHTQGPMPRFFAFTLDVSGIHGVRFRSEITYTGNAPGIRSSLVISEHI